MKSQSNLGNLLIIRLIKKSSKVWINLKSEIDQNLQSKMKNTWKMKNKIKLQAFWIVIKKVMMSLKKIHS